jgi:hypothetical protein
MGFKTVEMVRSIRDKHYEETREMSREEYFAYIKAKSDQLRNETVQPSPGKARSARRKPVDSTTYSG